MDQQEYFYDVLLANDHLSPVDRLDALVETLQLDRTLTETVLLTMEAVDQAVSNQIDDSRNFYIFRDTSVHWLLEQVLPSPVDMQAVTKIFIILNEVDLIFRFTTALKFKVADVADKQLRINSWGKAYITQKQSLTKNADLYRKLEALAQAYVTKHRATYKDLAALLVQSITPDSASKIAACNAGLAIKLVS